jgi:hypothetical protein
MTGTSKQRTDLLPLPFGERAGVRGWTGPILHFSKGLFALIARISAAFQHVDPSPQPSPQRGEGVAHPL